MGVYVLILVAALSGFIMCLLFWTLWEFNWIYPFTIIASGVCIYWTIKMMIRQHQKKTDTIIEQIKNGKVELLATWNFDEVSWAKYIAWRRQYNRKEGRFMTILSIVIGSIIFFFILNGIFDVVLLFLISAGSGLLFGVVIGSLFYWGYNIRMKNITTEKIGRIFFTENVILVNNMVINFNYLGSKLDAIEIIQRDDWNLIQIKPLTEFDDQNNEQTYLVPVPIDRLEEATELVETYQRNKQD